MIFTEIKTVAYRVHLPKWAFNPISGSGAGKHGGRANRIGVDALYLSLELETALAEYKQTSDLLPPGLIISYKIHISKVIDFRHGYDPVHWDPMWSDFFCDWRNQWFDQAVEPPSWSIGDEVIARGAKGILYSSVQTKGTNLVLYTNEITEPGSIIVYDPKSDLPVNQAAWD